MALHATGAEKAGPNVLDHEQWRRVCADALRDAIDRCDPHDADLIMSDALEKMRQGRPIPPLLNAMDEARNWASLTSIFELKAYCLAAYNALPPKQQAAFLVYVTERGRNGG